MGPFIEYRVHVPKQCYELDLLCFIKTLVNHAWGVVCPILWMKVLGLKHVDRVVCGQWTVMEPRFESRLSKPLYLTKLLTLKYK